MASKLAMKKDQKDILMATVKCYEEEHPNTEKNWSTILNMSGLGDTYSETQLRQKYYNELKKVSKHGQRHRNQAFARESTGADDNPSHRDQQRSGFRASVTAAENSAPRESVSALRVMKLLPRLLEDLSIPTITSEELMVYLCEEGSVPKNILTTCVEKIMQKKMGNELSGLEACSSTKKTWPIRNSDMKNLRKRFGDKFRWTNCEKYFSRPALSRSLPKDDEDDINMSGEEESVRNSNVTESNVKRVGKGSSTDEERRIESDDNDLDQQARVASISCDIIASNDRLLDSQFQKSDSNNMFSENEERTPNSDKGGKITSDNVACFDRSTSDVDSLDRDNGRILDAWDDSDDEDDEKPSNETESNNSYLRRVSSRLEKSKHNDSDSDIELISDLQPPRAKGGSTLHDKSGFHSVSKKDHVNAGVRGEEKKKNLQAKSSVRGVYRDLNKDWTEGVDSSSMFQQMPRTEWYPPRPMSTTYYGPGIDGFSQMSYGPNSVPFKSFVQPHLPVFWGGDTCHSPRQQLGLGSCCSGEQYYSVSPPAISPENYLSHCMQTMRFATIPVASPPCMMMSPHSRELHSIPHNGKRCIAAEDELSTRSKRMKGQTDYDKPTRMFCNERYVGNMSQSDGDNNIQQELQANEVWNRVLNLASDSNLNLGEMTENEWVELFKRSQEKTTSSGDKLRLDFFTHILPNIERIGLRKKIENLKLLPGDRIAMLTIYHHLPVDLSETDLEGCVKLLLKKNNLDTNFGVREWCHLFKRKLYSENERYFNCAQRDIKYVRDKLQRID